MEHRDVPAVAERAEQAALVGARVGQHVEGLIGMDRHDDVIEGRAVPARIDDAHPAGFAHDPGDGGTEPDAVGVAGGQPLDVGPATADHGAPDRAIVKGKEAVVVEEADEARRREVEDGGSRGRPDRPGHGQEVVVAEGGAVPARREIVAK